MPDAVNFDTPQQLSLSKFRASRAIPDCVIDHTSIQSGVTPITSGSPSKSLVAYSDTVASGLSQELPTNVRIQICRNQMYMSQLDPSPVITVRRVNNLSEGSSATARTRVLVNINYCVCLTVTSLFELIPVCERETAMPIVLIPNCTLLIHPNTYF